jgi:XTP/dITP diphosphohydrolase
MLKIVLATTNRKKAVEIAEIFGNDLAQIIPVSDLVADFDVEENGTTFVENARLKAVAAAQQTGMIAMADDSGLSVDALNGEPGVYSKRFAADDEARNSKLLEIMRGIPEEKRGGRFHCAVVIASPAEVLVEIDETTEGIIVDAPRGNNGFGYDPVFQAVGEKRTMAEMTLEEKNAISHRGKAFRKAAEWAANLSR